MRIGAFGVALVNGDVELASFGIENCGEFANVGVFCLYKIGCIGGNNVQCVDRDELCGVCQVHYFCQSNGYSQASEASGADGNINMLDVFWFSVELGQ